MNHDDPMLQELGILVAALVEGGLSAKQRDRLGELLRENSEARLFYRRYIELHAMLEWEAGAVTLHGSADATLNDLLEMEREAEAELVHQIGQLGGRDDRPRQMGGALRWAVERPALLGAVAAVLAVALVLITVLSGVSEQRSAAINLAPGAADDPTPVATLTAEHSAVWNNRPGVDLHAGQRFTLTEGFAEITTQRGAVAILEAPATIELIDNNAIRLYEGKIVGRCDTEHSRGFTVLTPSSRIVDIGTEFGVEVRNDGMSLTRVFEGEVRLMPTQTPGGHVALAKGEAVVVNPQGQLQAVEPNTLAFVRASEFEALVKADARAYARWSAYNEALKRDPDVVLHLDFSGGISEQGVIQNTAAAGLEHIESSGVRLTQGRFADSRAVQYQRDDDRIEINAEESYDELTLAGWFYLDNPQANTFVSLLTSYDWVDELGAIHWQLNSKSQSTFDHQTLSDAPQLMGGGSTPALPVHQWCHLVVTLDTHTGSAALYLNGQRINQVQQANRAGVPIKIGRAGIGYWKDNGLGNPVRTFNGRVDEFTIWKRAIRDGEVLNLFRAGQPSPGPNPIPRGPDNGSRDSNDARASINRYLESLFSFSFSQENKDV